MRILNLYGLTELGAVAACSADDPDGVRHTTAGRPLPGHELRVVDGELHVLSPYVGEWFRTGDLAELDDGCLRITGRISELVNVGGFNVSPAEVETVLAGHESVAAAVVVGVGGDETGEALHAFVVPRPGAEIDRADLLRFARARIAGYKLPYAIHVVPELPLLPSGKPDRQALRAGVKPFALLSRSPLFARLSPAELDELGPKLRPQTLEPGQEICRAGEPGDSLFVLEDGLAHVLSDDGRVVAKLRRGDVVGEMSLLTGEPRSATVVAALPTQVLELRQRDFAEAIGRSPVLLANLNRILSQRLAATTAQVGVERTRGEAVALVAGPTSTSARSSRRRARRRSARSPRSTAPPPTALAELDEQLAEHELVLVTCEPGQDGSRAERDRTPSTARSRRRPTDDVAWLGRHLARTKLGLALGAGGAKGYAHVGILRVLERAGYTVDYVAGSSIGAIVGALIGLGQDSDGDRGDDAPELHRGERRRDLQALVRRHLQWARR